MRHSLQARLHEGFPMADQDQKEDKFDEFDFDAAGEVRGYISLEQARIVAMRTARQEPGNYGGRYVDVRMVFEVV